MQRGKYVLEAITLKNTEMTSMGEWQMNCIGMDPMDAPVCITSMNNAI